MRSDELRQWSLCAQVDGRNMPTLRYENGEGDNYRIQVLLKPHLSLRL